MRNLSRFLRMVSLGIVFILGRNVSAATLEKPKQLLFKISPSKMALSKADFSYLQPADSSASKKIGNADRTNTLNPEFLSNIGDAGKFQGKLEGPGWESNPQVTEYMAPVKPKKIRNVTDLATAISAPITARKVRSRTVSYSLNPTILKLKTSPTKR